MLKQTLTILITISLCTGAHAQKAFEGLKVVTANFDTTINASIIPDSIFSLQPDLLYLKFPDHPIKTTEKYGYEIRWPSLYLDGSLILVITKRQIYLRSGHENPNPNLLYWFTNITPQQYRIIRSKINADKTLFKSRPSLHPLYRQLYFTSFKWERTMPKMWTKESEELQYQDWLEKKYKNTHALISFFNDGVTVDNLIPFVSKEAFEKEPVRIVYSESDYEDQIKLVPAPKEK